MLQMMREKCLDICSRSGTKQRMQGWIDAEISRVGSIYVVIIHPKIFIDLTISQNSVEPATLPTFSSIFLAHDPQLNDILI